MQHDMDHGYLDLVGHIYDGAVDPGQWPAIVQNIGEYMQASKAVIFTNLLLPEQGGFSFTWSIPPAISQQYFDHYQPHDVWTNAGIERGIFYEGNVVLGSELMPHQAFIESKIWLELLRQADMARLCTGVIFGVETQSASPVGISLFRGLEEPDFNEQDSQKLASLLTHLSRALGIMFALRDAEFKIAASRTALDGLRSGVLLLQADGVIVFSNHAASNMLASDDGLGIAKNGAASLQAGDAGVQDSINQIIATCVEPSLVEVPHFSQSVAVARPSGKPSYKLHFSRLPAQNGFGVPVQQPHAIVFITDSAQALHIEPAILKTTYGLTDAEVRLAQQCLTDDGMSAIKAALDISANTIKTQFASIYQKCGIRHRAELMQLLMALATS